MTETGLRAESTALRTYRVWCALCAVMLLAACLVVPPRAQAAAMDLSSLGIAGDANPQERVHGAWEFVFRAESETGLSVLLAGAVTLLIALVALGSALRRPSSVWIVGLTLAAAGALLASLPSYQVLDQNAFPLAKMSSGPKALSGEFVTGLLCVIVAGTYAVLRSGWATAISRLIGVLAGATIWLVVLLSGYFRALPIGRGEAGDLSPTLDGRNIFSDQLFVLGSWEHGWPYNLKIILFLTWGLLGVLLLLPIARARLHSQVVRGLGVFTLVALPWLSWVLLDNLMGASGRLEPFARALLSDIATPWMFVRSCVYAYGFLLLVGAGITVLLRAYGRTTAEPAAASVE